MLGYSKYEFDKKHRLMVGLPKNYKRYGIRDKVHTYLSSTVDKYTGHDAFGGVHLSTLKFGQRWSDNSGGATQKEVDQILDLRLPYEFLMNNSIGATTPDTKVGVDYFNPSYTLVQKLRNAITLDTASVASSEVQLYLRTNSVKHKFIVTNFARYPVLIIIEHLSGHDNELWDFSAGQPALASSTYNDLHSITDWMDQKGNLDTYVIPPNSENDQAGKKTWFDIDYNWKDAYGPEYSQSTPKDDVNNHVWQKLNKSYFSSSVTQQGAGVGIDFPFIASGQYRKTDKSNYGYKIRIHSLLLDPHGELHTHDAGVTADGDRATLNTNAFNLELVSQWDYTLAVEGSPHRPRHFGRFARAGGDAPA